MRILLDIMVASTLSTAAFVLVAPRGTGGLVLSVIMVMAYIVLGMWRYAQFRRRNGGI